MIALYRQGLRASFVIGLVFGIAFFVPLLSWLVNVAWYAWAALAIAEAVIFGLLAVGQRLLLGLPGWPLAVGGWWVAARRCGPAGPTPSVGPPGDQPGGRADRRGGPRSAVPRCCPSWSR